MSHYRAKLQAVVKTIRDLDLDQEQISELKRTPFWRLIEAILNNRVQYGEYERNDKVITKIISCFKRPSLKIVFENYEIQINEMDVRLIFGVQDGSKKLELYAEKFYLTPFLRRCFRERIGRPQYRLGIPLIRETLVEASGNNTNTDPQDVARLVTLYILATFFIPSTSSYLPWALTTILDDMEGICSYNWSALVIDRLITCFNHRKVKNHAGCVFMLPYWLCEHTKIVKPKNTQCFPRFLKWDLEEFGEVLMRTDLKDLNSDDIVEGSLKASEKEKILLGDKKAQQPLNEEVQQQISRRDVGGKRDLDILDSVSPAKKPCSRKMVTETKKCSKYDIIPGWAQVLESASELIKANHEDWIKRSVKEALEKKPPEWAKTILESLISKGVYNEKDLGPAKKAISSIISIVRCGVLSWMTENSSSQCPSDVETTPSSSSRPFKSIPEDNELILDFTYSSENEIPVKSLFSNVTNNGANSCKSIVLRAEVDLIKSRGDEREAFKTSDENLLLGEQAGKEAVQASKRTKTLIEDLSMEKYITKTEHKAEPSSAPLLAISKILESAYIAKVSYANLEKENEKLASELEFSNSRIQELEKELKDERVMSDRKSKKSREAVKAMEKRLKNNLQDEIRKEVDKITESLV